MKCAISKFEISWRKNSDFICAQISALLSAKVVFKSQSYWCLVLSACGDYADESRLAQSESLYQVGLLVKSESQNIVIEWHNRRNR